MTLEDELNESELIELARSQLTNIGNHRNAYGSGQLRYSISIDTFQSKSIEEIGQMLPTFEDGPGVKHLAWPETWNALKEEFHLFVCTGDKKYADLRKQLDQLGTKSQATIVSTISAALAIQIGIAAGIIVPFCALCLVAMIRMGKNAFCSTGRFDTKVGN